MKYPARVPAPGVHRPVPKCSVKNVCLTPFSAQTYGDTGGGLGAFGARDEAIRFKA